MKRHPNVLIDDHAPTASSAAIVRNNTGRMIAKTSRIR
jgi:hypothetical protein